MDNSDDEGIGQKMIHKIKRSTSSKGSTKVKKKEMRSQSFDTSSTERIEMLTPKQNGFVDTEEGETEEETMKHTASIKGMWKKAFKSLKSNDKQTTWLSKKGSIIKRKDSEPPEEEPEEVSKEIDPVYSLLKCAADLPKVPKAQKEAPCCSHLAGKADTSSGSTSKASSPSSSGVGNPFQLSLQPHHHHHHHHHHHASQYSIESASGVVGGAGGARATSPTITNREHMHHIVDESLGSEFRTFYKLTCPVKKHPTDGHSKKHSPNSSFDHH